MKRFSTATCLFWTVLIVSLCILCNGYVFASGSQHFDGAVSIGGEPPTGNTDLLYIQSTSGTSASIKFKNLTGNHTCHIHAHIGLRANDSQPGLATDRDFVIHHDGHSHTSHTCGGDIIISNESANGSIRFATYHHEHSTNSSASTERMRIQQNGYVKIGDPAEPAATMLHIGDSSSFMFESLENMRYGTLHSAQGLYAYSGMINSTTSVSKYDAIITWGDNIAEPHTTAQLEHTSLYFIHEANSAEPLESQSVMQLKDSSIVIGNHGTVTKNVLTVYGNIIPHSLFSNLGAAEHNWTSLYCYDNVIVRSDERFLTSIEDILFGLDEVLALDPVWYFHEDKEEAGRRLGFKAQQTQNVIAEIVEEPDNQDHPMGMRNGELIPVLVRAIQEQQAIIDEGVQLLETLQDDVEELQQIIDNQGALINVLGGTHRDMRPDQNSALQTSLQKFVPDRIPHSAFLMPSYPNPVSETAALSFFLPSAVQNAALVLYNSVDGREVWRSGIGAREVVALDISVADFPAGLYLAVLISDGVAADSSPIRVLR